MTEPRGRCAGRPAGQKSLNKWFMFADRRSPLAFWLGSFAVVFGVLLHIPAFLMAHAMHYRMVGMPMGAPMLCGMACILAGAAASAFGLQPKRATSGDEAIHQRIVAPEDAPLTVWHWMAGAALAIALVVDIMTVAGLSWGFVNFGLLLWLPGELIAHGRNMGLAAALIARSTLFAVPVMAIAAFLYSRWSTKGTLLVITAITAAGILALVPQHSGVTGAGNPLLAPALLIVGSTGVISVLLPYAAGNYPLRIRGRATGWVAGCSKADGLICQELGVLALVPALRMSAPALSVPVVLALALIAWYGRETRGRDLRELERAVAPALILT